MIREQRQYLVIRASILVSGLGLLITFVITSLRLWPIVHRALFPATMNCGCSVVAVQAPGMIVGAATIVMALTAWSIIRMAWRGWLMVRTTRLLERRYRLNHFRTVYHQHLGFPIRVLPTLEPLAMTLGFFRPAVYLSEGVLHTLRHSEVTAVLRHEQAHQRALDPLGTLLLESIVAGWSWIPGVRGMMVSLYSQREVAADAIATNGYNTVTALSGAFLALLGVVHHPSVAAFSPNRDRMEKLLDRDWRPEQAWWKWRTLMALVVILGGVLFLRTTAKAGMVQPQQASAICHQAIVMCQQSPSSTASVQSCSGLTCITVQRLRTPAYASPR